MVFYEQSLRYAQKIILGILKHMHPKGISCGAPVVIFFACLDLEQKSSFMDGHYLTSFQNSYRKNGSFKCGLLSKKFIFTAQ